MQSIIRYLRSESFIFAAILCVLFSQILHTAYLFNEVSRLSLTIGSYNLKGISYMHALICAIAIEGAILMFIINGKKKAAQLYAFASFMSNLLYYRHWHDSFEQLIASTLISAMLSGSIWYFSDLFVEKLKAGEKPIEQKPDKSPIVMVHPKPFTCSVCGQAYATEQQLRGHLSGHARRAKKPVEITFQAAESTEIAAYKAPGITREV